MGISLLDNRNFLLHWGSLAIAQTGSFFTLVALPWMVLSMTDNDPFIMATVMATISLCQGFFILFGGALADRFSPIKLLFLSRLMFCVVMASLAVFVYLSKIPLWLIYIYAFVLGTLGAFGIPASQSLLPAIVDKSELGKANGIVMGTVQLTQIIGPVAAGWLIWFVRSFTDAPSAQADYHGFAVAFLVDAIAILLAVVLLSIMKVAIGPKAKGNLFTMVTQGVVFCWKDRGIRLVLAYLILISFFLHGPLLTALPLIIKVELGLSEGAYGTLYAMIGIGTVIGAGIAALTTPSPKALGAVVLSCDLISGACLYLLGKIGGVWTTGGTLLIMGICSGIIMIAGITWFQNRTPDVYMGRVMSILMFCILGLIPISASLAGFLIGVTSISLVIIGAGIAIMVVSGVGLLIPRIRNMGDTPISVGYELGLVEASHT